MDVSDLPTISCLVPQPFLTPDGEVDLSGGGGRRQTQTAAASTRAGADVSVTQRDGCGMNAMTTINFSLPSASNGETDATGLCTIKLINNLVVSDNYHLIFNLSKVSNVLVRLTRKSITTSSPPSKKHHLCRGHALTMRRSLWTFPFNMMMTTLG